MKGSEMEEQIKTLKTTYDWGHNRVHLTQLSNHIHESFDNPAELKNIEKELLGVLTSDAKYAAKDFVCRELCKIGTEQSVPVLAQMLSDEQCSDIARYALEHISGSSVDEALRNALAKTNGKTKIGIISSIGVRGDNNAVGALSELISNSDQMVGCAAAVALGDIGGAEAANALTKAKSGASGQVLMPVLDALLKCADKLAAQGGKSQANAIYKELYSTDMPAIIRAAAMRGMISSAGPS